ncbi:MAG: hypothetical protein ABIG45_07125 [Bacillota bacterium]
MRAAAIGIGSNSLRLLVADVKYGQLTAILRDREGLRVFAALNENLEISPDMIRVACESVARMRRIAERLGAEEIRLFATSAVRDAKNKSALGIALLKAAGLMLDICSGELEAKLSFLGATEAVRSGMIDIGGGSTEIVIGERDIIDYACSLQAGAVRLFREMPILSARDAHRVKEAVSRLLQPHLSEISQMKTPAEWVGVGGTFTAAATYMLEIAWDTDAGIHGFLAKRLAVMRAMETLAGMTPEQRGNLHTIPPDRADIIVHGFAILLGCMESLQIRQIKVSERTNLDGYLKLFIMGE